MITTATKMTPITTTIKTTTKTTSTTTTKSTFLGCDTIELNLVPGCFWGEDQKTAVKKI